MKNLSGTIANALLVGVLVLLLLETVSGAPYCLLRAPYNPPQGNCFQFHLADTTSSPARATAAGGVCAVTPLAAREGWELDPTFPAPLSTWAEGDTAMGVVSPYFGDAYGCQAAGGNNVGVGNGEGVSNSGGAAYCLLRAPYNPPQDNCYQFYVASTTTSAARATAAGGACDVTPLGAREGWKPDALYPGPFSTFAEADAAMSKVSPYFDDAYGCHATGGNNSVGNGGNGCPSGQTNCGGTCTDTSSDSQNCGYCGNVCASEASCTSGICSASNGPIGQNAANGTSYHKGSLLAGPISLPANLSDPQDVVLLEKDKPYIVVGEGVCSLWDGHTDGVDSVFCYAQWRIGNTPLVWGQLELIDPSIHLSDLIKTSTGKPAEYNPSHIYEAVVIGEGTTLKARVYDDGGYSDNHGDLRISVYQAVEGP